MQKRKSKCVYFVVILSQFWVSKTQVFCFSWRNIVKVKRGTVCWSPDYLIHENYLLRKQITTVDRYNKIEAYCLTSAGFTSLVVALVVVEDQLYERQILMASFVLLQRCTRKSSKFLHECSEQDASYPSKSSKNKDEKHFGSRNYNIRTTLVTDSVKARLAMMDNSIVTTIRIV